MNPKGSSLLSWRELFAKKGPSFPLRFPMRSFARARTPRRSILRGSLCNGSVCAHRVTELFVLFSVLSLRVTSLLLLFFGIPEQ